VAERSDDIHSVFAKGEPFPVGQRAIDLTGGLGVFGQVRLFALEAEDLSVGQRAQSTCVILVTVRHQDVGHLLGGKPLGTQASDERPLTPTAIEENDLVTGVEHMAAGEQI
jgi:hypothetical protein